MITAEQLRALQKPIKARYAANPETARVTLLATGQLEEGITCRVSARRESQAGLHPATGGDGSHTCSGNMLLDALVACAGVTLRAVATALEIPLSGGRVTAEGDLDFRGTLGVSKEVPVGFLAIRLAFQLDTSATPDQLATLARLTERYCVVLQSLKSPVQLTLSATNA
jgi:uncharacterized OsmC-like protein